MVILKSVSCETRDFAEYGADLSVAAGHSFHYYSQLPTKNHTFDQIIFGAGDFLTFCEAFCLSAVADSLSSGLDYLFAYAEKVITGADCPFG